MTDPRSYLVPLDLFGHFFPRIAPFLARGLNSADLGLEEAVNMVLTGRAQAWAVLETVNDKPVIAGAFLTSIDEEDGGAVVSIFAMGGDGAERWARPGIVWVEEFAKREGAGRVRFSGRDAWRALLPDYAITSRRESGEAIFERAVA